MFDSRSITTVTVIGLGLSVIYLLAKNKADREFASAEKLNLFGICMELATDNIVLQKEISELKSKNVTL